MVHVVYCDKTGKKGERELDKILNGQKTNDHSWSCGKKNPT